MGFDFVIEPFEVDEYPISGESPAAHVLRLASIKSAKGAEKYPDDLVVGADTAVVIDGKILGKPQSEKDAFEMLTKLAGRTHTVFTGLSLKVFNAGIDLSDYDTTDVLFNQLSEDKIREYIQSGEPLDKAGSYGIQGMGSFLVNSYSGELDTVIGFPSKLFRKMYGEAISCLNR
jgi:septum formation protein